MNSFTSRKVLQLCMIFQVKYIQLQTVNSATSQPTQSIIDYLQSTDCHNSLWTESQTGGVPVTRIDITYFNKQGNQIQGFKVNGLDDFVPYRSDKCPSTYTTLATIILAPSDTITKIETWYKSQYICKVQFTVSNSSVYSYTSTASDTSNVNTCTLTSATFSPSKQFVGFWGHSESDCDSGCLVAESITVGTTQSCSTDSIATINVSSFNQGSLILVTGVTQTKTLTATTTFGLTTCQINYSVTVTPSGPCAQLITLSGSTLTFAASDVLANAAVCTVEVKASIGEVTPTAWSASTTGTFRYVDPCLTATMSTINFNPITVHVGAESPSSTAMWQDSVTATKNNGTIICAQTPTFYVSSAPPAPANSTMYLKFTYTTTSSTLTSGQQTIKAAPTLPSEVGAYNLNFKVCVTANPDSVSGCKDTSILVTIVASCAITLVKIIQSPSGALQHQSWTLSATNPFTYQLAVDTTTTCGYTPTAWIVSASGGLLNSNFQTIDNSGLFSANVGTFTALALASTYTIQVSSVTINGNVYGGTSQIANTASTPSTFTLDVLDPCTQAIIYPSTISSFFILAFATVENLGSFSDFTYVDQNGGNSLCGAFTYNATLALGSANNTLSTFTFNAATRNFQVQSLNLNQVGTFKVTLKGMLTNYPTRIASTNFTITVLNPCYQTTLISSSYLVAMNYSISQSSPSNQQAGPFNDGLDAAQSITPLKLCGALSSWLIDVPASGVAALNSTELSVNSSMLISIQTTNPATVGVHTITLNTVLSNFTNVTTTQTFKLTILSTDTQIISQEVDLTPIQNLIETKYVIGGTNLPLKLLQFYKITQDSRFNMSFQPIQTQGMIVQSFKVDPQFEFAIQVNETKFVNTSVSFQIYATTDLPNQIPNQDLIIKFLFQANNTQESQKQVEKTQVSVEEKISFLFQGVTQKNQSSYHKTVTQHNVAKIASVSQLGLVTIQFHHLLYVPQFKESVQNTNTSNTNRLLKYDQSELTLDQFIDKKALKVSLITKQSVESIEWICKNFTKSTLLIQLIFKNPLEVSSNGFDRISVKFQEPKLFVLNDMSGFLFTQEDQEILIAQIPPQFPSQKAQAVFKSVSQAITNSAPEIIVVSLLLQIIAKKVISSMFIYYSTLQIILLINLEANLQLPSSVILFTDTIDGIINLSSLDKHTIGEKLSLPQSTFQGNGLLQKLSGVSLAILVIIIFAVVILLIRKFNIGEKLKIFVKKQSSLYSGISQQDISRLPLQTQITHLLRVQGQLKIFLKKQFRRIYLQQYMFQFVWWVTFC